MLNKAAQGDLTGVVFPSSQGDRGAFVDQVLSSALKMAGYDLVPMDFLRAHKA